MKITSLFLSMSLAWLSAPNAWGADSSQVDDAAAIKKVLNRLMPNRTPDSLLPASVPGFYEVVFGAQVLYISNDGKYLLEGDLYDLDRQKNLTEVQRSKTRLKTIQAIDKNSMIVFSPKKVSHTVTVFTDIDCGYCRKLHREIDDYLAKGIEIRYLAFPRSGVNTPSYYKAVSVWCADDKKTAMTNAKTGSQPEEKKCNSPVDQHMAAAEIVGVTGTPTLVLEDGRVVPGYVPADRLTSILEAKN